MENMLLGTGIGLTKGILIYPIFSQEMNVELDEQTADKVINYLKNGYMIIAFMGRSTDNEGDDLGYYAFYTDGLWIWPEYYWSFLEMKKTNKIDKKFLDYIFKNNFVIPNISKNKLDSIIEEAHIGDFVQSKLMNTLECTDAEIREQKKLLSIKNEENDKIQREQKRLRRIEERKRKKGLL